MTLDECRTLVFERKFEFWKPHAVCTCFEYIDEYLKHKIHYDKALAEKAGTDIFEKLSEDDFKKLRLCKDSEKFPFFFRSALEFRYKDWKIRQDGKREPPKEIKEAGDTAVRIWKMMYIQRMSPIDIENYFESFPEPDQETVKRLIGLARSRPPQRGDQPRDAMGASAMGHEGAVDSDQAFSLVTGDGEPESMDPTADAAGAIPRKKWAGIIEVLLSGVIRFLRMDELEEVETGLWARLQRLGAEMAKVVTDTDRIIVRLKKVDGESFADIAALLNRGGGKATEADKKQVSRRYYKVIPLMVNTTLKIFPEIGPFFKGDKDGDEYVPA